MTGTLDGPASQQGRARAQQNGIEREVRRDTRVADFELKYPSGHQEAIPVGTSTQAFVIANLKSGAVWRQIGCTATKVSKGEPSLKSHRTMCRTLYPIPQRRNATAVLEITQL